MAPFLFSHFGGFQGENFVSNWRNLYMLWDPGSS